MTEKKEFQTEVSRLLDIVANSLYSDKQVFLRELISNSSDACDRRRYLGLTNKDLVTDNPEYKIRIGLDTDARTLTIKDNGIGMDYDDLIANLGTIAHSGTAKAVSENADKDEKLDLIGKFGVGFYASFMVAGNVEVISKKAGDDKAWKWVSDGVTGYTIDEVIKDDVGTEITLHIKDDASEFLLEEKLKQVIKKYSDHISFPIIFGDADDAEPINKASAIWMRPKSDITTEEYNEFYGHVNPGMQFDAPWLTMHWRAEGVIEYTNLIFIPTMKPFDLYDPKRENSIRLYVKRVFITDGVEGLILPFLRFLRGVVDCEDLPLNISREMLQNNPVVSKISQAITKKVLKELQKMAENEPDKFAEFWDLFGPVVKEGLYDAHQYREDLNKVVRFYSSDFDNLVSFEEYVSRMKEGQEHIYYLSGTDIESLRKSPQLEGFKAKGVEVLLMVDAIDEYWLPVAFNYDGKTFKSITKGESELENIGKTEKEIKEAEKAKKEDVKENNDPVLLKIKEILKEEVNDVRYSNRLVESPVCLVAQDGAVDMHMERMLKNSAGYEELSKRVLEINENHSVIKKLKSVVANDGNEDILNDTAWLLLDQAKIIEGESLTDPTAFVKRMSKLADLQLDAAAKA